MARMGIERKDSDVPFHVPDAVMWSLMRNLVGPSGCVRACAGVVIGRIILARAHAVRRRDLCRSKHRVGMARDLERRRCEWSSMCRSRIHHHGVARLLDLSHSVMRCCCPG
jgi:hypothetical protein